MGKAAVTCRDLAPPSEPRRKGFARTCGYASTGGGVFLKLINLTVVICILSLIAPCFRRGKLVPVETGIARPVRKTGNPNEQGKSNISNGASTKAAWHGLPAREKMAKMAVPPTLLNATARTCAARTCTCATCGEVTTGAGTENAGTGVTNAESTRLGEGRSRSRTGGSVLRPEKIGTAKDDPLLNESGIKSESEAHRPGSATNNSSANSEEKAEELNEWESIRMRVTAYCPCPKCCGEYSDGVTACGYKIRPGDTFVAADRRYSFGTEMLIPGYSNGRAVKVLDRGGAIKGNRLDVFFATHQEALEWGVRGLDIKVRHK